MRRGLDGSTSDYDVTKIHIIIKDKLSFGAEYLKTKKRDNKMDRQTIII